MTLGHYMIIDGAFGNDLGLGIHTYGGLMSLGHYLIIGMWYPCDHAYEAHKVLQTSGEVFVPLFCGFGTLMVINI